MSDPISPANGGSPPSSRVLGARLDSWKAIAEYLGRHVTTVQRWEQEEDLPIHRHQHEKRGSVYGYTAELDAWFVARTPTGASSAGVQGQGVTVAEPSQGVDAPAVRMRSAADETDTDPIAPRPLSKTFLAWALALSSLGLTIVGITADSLWSPRRTGNSPMSLAVLPLHNRSADPKVEYFVDGMTEALTTDLASLHDIRVIARQSVMQYRNSGKPASVIATDLKVDALVEGAVQRSGDRVRVDIRLIDGRTSRSLWAASYERGLQDVLALQAELSRAIVHELHLTLEPQHDPEMGTRRPANPDAWDAYLRARFYWNKRTHEDMKRAIEWYERAIAFDSTSALIYAGLADVYATLGPPNLPIADLIARGTVAAERAIQLDPNMGEPLAALGKLNAYAWNWQAAEENYLMAIERAPGYAPARYWYGSFLANHRRCDEAFAQAREAERLDPVSLPGNMVISGIELRCGRVDRAVKRSLTVLEFDPNYSGSRELLGRAYLAQGKPQDAISVLTRAPTLTDGRPTVRATLAYAYALAGRSDEARAIARELADRHKRDKTLASAWSVAIAHVGLRRYDEALTWLQHSYEDHEEWLEAVAVDERFRPLKAHPRFQDVLVRLGLPNGHEPTRATRASRSSRLHGRSGSHEAFPIGSAVGTH